MTDYLSQFGEPRVVEVMFIDAWQGKPPIYSVEPHLRRPAISFEEMMERVQHYAVERLSQPFIDSDGDFAFLYDDMCSLLTQLDSKECLEFAKEIARDNPIKDYTSPGEAQATDKQRQFIRKLGYMQPVTTRQEAARIIARLSKR